MLLHRSLLAAATAALLLTGSAVQAEPHSYQVTGPILAITDSSITVQKGAEKWEIEKKADTKITGELKVGAKVTIEYYMTGTSITVKPAAGKAK